MICGVYEIWNTVSNKTYIGSSEDCVNRIYRHKWMLRNGKHHSIHLQRAFNKYGADVFIFTILFYCKRGRQLAVEQVCLDKLKPEYNSSLSAKAPMKGRVHSESTKLKLSLAPRKIGKDHPSFGRKASAEERKARSEFTKGRKFSDAIKLNMKQSAKQRGAEKAFKFHVEKLKKQIIDHMGNIFESTVAAASFHGLSQQTVSDHARGRYKISRFKFYVGDKNA